MNHDSTTAPTTTTMALFFIHLCHYYTDNDIGQYSSQHATCISNRNNFIRPSIMQCILNQSKSQHQYKPKG